MLFVCPGGAIPHVIGQLYKPTTHVAGPLGKPTHNEKFDGAMVCVGGGIGVASIHPIAKAMKAAGNQWWDPNVPKPTEAAPAAAK